MARRTYELKYFSQIQLVASFYDSVNALDKVNKRNFEATFQEERERDPIELADLILEGSACTEEERELLRGTVRGCLKNLWGELAVLEVKRKEASVYRAAIAFNKDVIVRKIHEGLIAHDIIGSHTMEQIHQMGTRPN